MTATEPAADLYRRAWSPREYLRQYYAAPAVSDDERAIYRFLASHLRGMGRTFRRGIDVGCGPTLHHAIPLVPHVEALDLADYLPGNLVEVRRWLNDEPDAHDWTTYVRGALEAEGQPADDAAIDQRIALLRSRVRELRTLDLTKPIPGHGGAYDLVASFYCVEAISPELDRWQERLGRVAGMVAPGGVLFLAALRNCRSYRVFGRTFPTACVNEADFRRVMPTLGFATSSLAVEAVPIREWVDQGFDGICLVKAVKA